MTSYTRPFWPLFLHVIGAMTLVGAVLTAAIVSWVAWRRPGAPILARTAFNALAFVGVPAYVVMRIFAQVIASDEGLKHNLPSWVTIGQGVADGGLLLLLATSGSAFWWRRSSKQAAARTVAVLSAVYLVLLAVAWLAMSGKWG
jgi:cytochrome bd-type quinol oxidase subunit 1